MEEDSKKEHSNMAPSVVDIGINLTHKAFRKHWRSVVKRAIDAGVDKIILTGTSIKGSRESRQINAVATSSMIAF